MDHAQQLQRLGDPYQCLKCRTELLFNPKKNTLIAPIPDQNAPDDKS